MAEAGFKRKLAAILSADVEGYSRLMDDDEEATVRTLKAYRAAINDLVQQYRGRIVDSPGDNILAEFNSVVDAVNCAVEIQRDLAERNTALADNRQMQFRIGVNLGDVIEDDGNIYGDGVNIAARVESLAEAGGICISGRAYDQVLNKLGLEYENLGEHQVKNISVPIRVYRVLSYPGAAAHRVVQAKETLGRKWRKIAISAAVVIVVAAALGIWQFYMQSPSIEPASVEKMAYPLPDKPSIAVLPFVNMSGDPEQEYIGDSITENIITALSYIPEMFVIARTSTSAYKGKAVNIKQVSEELGVRYVLEGSIQKAGDQIRVTAQLIDAISGHHLWADRYDRDIEDFFNVLDDIAKKVAIELQVKLTEGDIARISHKTENFEAWASATAAYSFLKLISKENIARAKELSEKAVGLDPGYGFAWGILGAAHDVEGMFGWSESRDESFKLAVEYTDKALALDKNLSCATSVRGRIYRLQGDFDQAIATGEKAIALGPGHDLSYSTLSATMLYAGKFEESITLMKKAMRLNPHYPAWYLFFLATGHFYQGQYAKAVEAGNRLLERSRKGEWPPILTHLILSAAYTELGRREAARSHVEEVLKINPKFSLENHATLNHFKNKSDFERYLVSLRKAGLPDETPRPLPEKPSIAVLPFDNLSDDPGQEYFSDGMIDDIITDLSKIKDLLVISRNSTFTFKGKEKKIPEIARELNVRYILEGSVRRAGDQVRINAQLIDAKTDHHLWAERFDDTFQNIFKLQDKITDKIVTALALKLSSSEEQIVADKGTLNMAAYDAYLKGMIHKRRFTPDDYVKAISYFKQAIELDPGYSQAYAELAHTYWIPLKGGKIFWDKIGDYRTCRIRARHYLEIAMKKPTSRAYQLMARMELFKRNFDNAIDLARRAVAIAPNDADAMESLGNILVWTGSPEEAIGYYQKSIMLDPLYKSTNGLGGAYFTMGDFEKAVKYIEKALKDYPNAMSGYGALAAAYGFLGNEMKAKAAFKKFYS